jgi:hypothetical protein
MPAMAFPRDHAGGASRPRALLRAGRHSGAAVARVDWLPGADCGTWSSG